MTHPPLVVYPPEIDVGLPDVPGRRGPVLGQGGLGREMGAQPENEETALEIKIQLMGNKEKLAPLDLFFISDKNNF